MKTLGRFDDQKREYKIEDMYPPRPLVNYLWNERFLASLDQFGCGFSRYKDENGVFVNLCSGNNSRLFFIRDELTGEYWSANRNFGKAAFQDFYAVVGQGYSKVVSLYHGVEFSVTLSVPVGGPMEYWQVTLANKAEAEKKLSLFTYADININITPHAAYNHGSFPADLNGVFLSHHGFNLPTKFTNIFLTSDREVAAFETTNRRFRGVYGGIQYPDALSSPKLASMETAFDPEMIAALQHTVTLQAGETKRFHFILGLAASLAEAVEIRKTRLSLAHFEKELQDLKTEAEMTIQKVIVETPHAEINSLANIWLKRQISLGKTWGRVYGKGIRDILQDTTGFAALDHQAVAEKIKLCLSHQYEDGNTVRQFDPLDLHPYRDGASWIIPAVAAYIKETGDMSFLSRMVPYYESKIQGTVLEHCLQGIEFLLSELGEHGLCLWGGGDWNDSINNAGMLLKGESLWLSEAAVKSALELADLLEQTGEKAQAAGFRGKAKTLADNILKHGWDRDHFIYGYNDWHEKIGAYENSEGKIYLNPQTWAVLAGIVKDSEAQKLLDLVERELSCPFGYVQLKPSYTRGSDRIGRISYMENGCYENGSVYNHGVVFKIAADCKLGRGNLAYQSVLKMLSSNPENPAVKSGVEPYVMTNMYIGPENRLRAGESVSAWITGTAGWMFRCIVEFIIGIQADYNGLKVDPCLPSHWKELKIARAYRNGIYRIQILNPDGIEKGIIKLTVDGRKIDGNLIPVFNDGQIHNVLAEVGGA